MDKILARGALFWRENAFKLGAILVTAFLIFYKLSSIPRGLSKQEVLVTNKLMLHQYDFLYLWRHVLYSPYTFFLIVLRHLHLYNIGAIRSISAFFGLITVALFLYIVFKWYGFLISILSTAIFTTSLWFLQSSRLSFALSLYSLTTLLLVVLFFVDRGDKKSTLITSISILLSAVILYIPGMIWFLAACLIIKRRKVLLEISELKRLNKLILGVAWLILIVPLIWSAIHNLTIVKNIFGLPGHINWHAALVNFYHLPQSIFIRSSFNNVFSIGHIPMLDVFSTIMVLFGFYYLYKTNQRRLMYSFLAGLAMSWILYSFSIVPIYVILTILSLIISSGLCYLLSLWFTVFPRNPVARGVGIGLISLAVLAVVLLHINQFYIAWPHTITTLSTYSLQS